MERKRLKPIEQLKVVELRKKGVSARVIGQLFDCSKEQVYNIDKNSDDYKDIAVIDRGSIITELRTTLRDALKASLKPFNGNGEDVVVTQDLKMQKCKTGDVVQVQHVTVNYNVSNNIIKALEITDKLRDML